MACKKCNSERIASVGGKCSDLFSASIGGAEHDGYVPDDMGIGAGDYLELDYCLDCGQIQGEFPLPKTEIETEYEERRDEELAKAEKNKNFNHDEFFNS